MIRKLALLLVTAVTFAAVNHAALADDYPSRPIRIVVPFAPGAGNDLLGRLMAEQLSNRMGQSVFVENKAGAGSQIGIDLVAKSKPDGYNIVLVASDGLSILPAVRPAIPYKVPDDFAFIARLLEIPNVVAINPNLPIHTMAELVEYAKTHPLKYGSSGIGSAPHIGMAMIEKAAGIQMLHVPYPGVAPAINAVIAGTIDAVLVTPPTLKPFVDAGKMRALAVTGPTHHPLLPNVPTLKEAGVNANMVIWYGIAAPAGTPEPVLAKLRNEVGEVLRDPAVVKRLSGLGYQVAFLPGDAFRDYVVKDLEQWKGVAKAANIVLE
jgi:tripartite-type tricarboxylate transporter receptor subunit TctC